MKRICNYAKVTQISDEFLKDTNKELNLERAQLRFQFVCGAGSGAGALISSVDTSNGGSKLIDVSSIEGETTAKKCKALKRQFDELAISTKEEIAEKLGCKASDLSDDDVKSFRYPKFTVYTFTISELIDGATAVNNGERTYSTMSTTYLEAHNDAEEAKRVVRDQLQKRLDSGDYELGELEKGDDD